MAETNPRSARADDDHNDAYIAKKKETRKLRSYMNRREIEIELNLAPMIDMMTVLLTFMLKQYGSEPIQLNESKDLRIPYSSAEAPPKDTLTISITKRWVMVLDDSVTPINDGQIDPSALQSSESSIIPELQQRVEEALAQQEQFARILGRDFVRVCTIIADESVPYRVLTQVMMTAASGGVQEFKFAVLQRAQGSGLREAK